MNIQNLVGVDTHKDSLACYCNGKFKEFSTTKDGFIKAIKWANSSNWAIEGAYCFGQAFSNFLIKNGCEVYEINPLLTKSWRTALKVASPKNDYGDAKVISIFANMNNMNKVSFETIKLKEKLTAVAPIDCSSGKTTRKRNNKGGNRILNSIFYSLSIAQKRYNEKAKAYYEKKISEGKTPRHARKCLARQLTNIVFRTLKNATEQGKP